MAHDVERDSFAAAVGRSIDARLTLGAVWGAARLGWSGASLEAWEEYADEIYRQLPADDKFSAPWAGEEPLR